jgi:hypothetical protein
MIPTQYIVVFFQSAQCYEELAHVLERVRQLEEQAGKQSPPFECLPIAPTSPIMMSVPERLKFQEFQTMLAKWPGVRSRLRALEEARGLPEPPCERPKREPMIAVMPGLSLPHFDVFEQLKQLNAEFPWVKARAGALETAPVRAEAN